MRKIIKNIPAPWESEKPEEKEVKKKTVKKEAEVKDEQEQGR